MLYISKIKNEMTKIGVTDTTDGVEEFFTNAELVKVIKQLGKTPIYGVFVYNNKAVCTAQKLNVPGDMGHLRNLLDAWKKMNNPWNTHPVENYMACLKVGTELVVDYIVTPDSNPLDKERGRTILRKIEQDLWHYEDTSNVYGGSKFNSIEATRFLGVAWVYCKPIALSVHDRSK